MYLLLCLGILQWFQNSLHISKARHTTFYNKITAGARYKTRSPMSQSWKMFIQHHNEAYIKPGKKCKIKAKKLNAIKIHSQSK